MARTNLTVQSVSRSGLNLSTTGTSVLAANNAKFDNSTGDVTVIADNSAGGAPITVSLVIAETVDGQTPAAKDVAVPAGDIMEIGGFPTDIYNQPSGADKNYVYINVSGTITLIAKR